MSMGSRIKQARLGAKLSQTDLAEIIDVSHSTINRWEADHRAPSRARIIRIANATKTPVDWLENGSVPSLAIRPDYRDFEATAPRHIPTNPSLLEKTAMPAPEGPTPSNAPQHPTTFKETKMVVNPVEQNPVIAFQGVPGAYSHLACKNAFPQMEPIACPSFEDAFAAVEEGRAGLAMIPIENSLGGRVADVHHLLPESNLYIVGEHFQPVHHQLLAVKGATLADLKHVRSHPQALAQCRKTLRELNLSPVKEADTAGSALQIAELGDPSIGAIASELAAETYDLAILRSRLEDKIGNVTRFVVLSRTRIEPDPRAGKCLTSFIFTARSVPASLYKCLGGFATNGVNFINLESYISIGDPTTARFYAEIEGHPADKSVDHAFEELQFYTSKLKILGTYPMSPFRDRD